MIRWVDSTTATQPWTPPMQLLGPLVRRGSACSTAGHPQPCLTQLPDVLLPALMQDSAAQVATPAASQAQP